MTAISSQIVANNSNVYAEIAYQDPKRNRPEGVLDSDLIVLNEKEHWKEKDRIRLTSDGAIVYACDRAEGVMDEWAKACSEDNNTRVLPLYFDVTDATAVKSAFMSVFKQEGRIDVLINNAGVVFNKKIGMILRPETELMFRVNVIAVIEMIQLVSRLMARNHSGSIVNIASVTAVLGSPGQSA